MKKHLSILLVLLPLAIMAQETAFRIDSLPQGGILLDIGWKWQAGDNPDFAKPDFDDSSWERIDPTKNILDIPQLWNSDIGWFRIKIDLDSSLLYKPSAIKVNQTGAADYFLNGVSIGGFGDLSNFPVEIIAEQPLPGSSLGLPITKTGVQTLAIRFAVQKDVPYYGKIPVSGLSNIALNLQVVNVKHIASSFNEDLTAYFITTRFGVSLIMALIFFALFLYHKTERANLYFSIYSFIYALTTFNEILIRFILNYSFEKEVATITNFTLVVICYIFLLSGVYHIFSKSRGITFWLLISLGIIPALLTIINYQFSPYFNWVILLNIFNLEILRIAWLGLKQGKRGAKIILYSGLVFLLFSILFVLVFVGVFPLGYRGLNSHLAFNIALLAIPISIGVHLASESSFFNRNLRLKLVEVERLSAEKEQILSEQNVTLEKKVMERTAKLKASQSQLIQSEKMASLGELTAGIAHEIQNPLNFVNNFSEVTEELVEELEIEGKKEQGERDRDLEKELFADIKDNLIKINHHGNRASSIVKGMLEHSRTSSGKKELTDINALADEYLRLAYHGLRAKEKDFNAEMVADFDKNIPKIEVIPQDIGRVFLNLINNAFQAVSEEGERRKAHGDLKYKPLVTVLTKLKANSQLLIAIKDNGPGIPDEIKDKIFQPFFTTKDSGKGTGLGLSLAYDIVKAHGGEISVDSEVGKGTQFLIRLPV